jgi:hypothetical protein
MSMILYITIREAPITDSSECVLFFVHAARPNVDYLLQWGGSWPSSISQNRDRGSCRIRRAKMLIAEAQHDGHSDWHTNCFTPGQQSAVSEAMIGA